MPYSPIELQIHALSHGLDMHQVVLQRGLRYWQQGRVRSVRESVDGSLSAIVEGSFDYDVTLNKVEFGVTNRLIGHCNCPYGAGCKHVAALLVELLQRQDGSGVSAVDNVLSTLSNLDSPAARSEDSGRLEVKVWRKPAPKSGGQHFVSLEVLPFTRRLSKTGKPLKPKLSLQRFGPVDDAGMCAEHRAMLHWLMHFKPTYSPRKEIELPSLVVGKFLASALDEAILVDAETEVLMSRGEPRHMALAWHTQADEHSLIWQLDGQSLDDQMQLIEVETGYWYCDLAEGLMGEVMCEYSQQRIAAVARLPKLDSDQRQQVEIAIVGQTQAPGVLALSAAKDAPEVQPKLSGKKLYGDSQAQTLTPWWHYGGDYWVQAEPGTTRSFLPEHGRWLLRDAEAELGALSELNELVEHVAPERQSRGALRLRPLSDFQWAQFSLDVVPRLQAAGWQVELPEDLQYRANDVYELSVDMADEDEKGWWFEVGFSVEFEGRKLPLVPILAEWVARHGLDEGPLAGLTDDELYPLSVDADGNVWRVPVKLLRTLVLQFADLIEHADGERLQLPQAAMAHLDDVLGELPTVPWQPPARLLELAEQLRSSKAPVAMDAPEGFGAQLRPYQQSGVGWLQFLADTGMHGVLADDMGLGKTVQTLAHICHQRRAEAGAAPVLVVAPTSVVGNWRRECEKFSPELKPLMLQGPERKAWLSRLGEFDLVLTSYALLQRDIEDLREQPFSLVVLDEAQWIKNPRAKTSMAAKSLNGERRLCLSGTPMENHTGELWSLFDFLMPGFLGSEKRFRETFRTPIEKLGNGDALARLRNRTAPFVLRRDKQLVAADLPARNEMLQSVEMGNAQKAIYEAVRARMEKKVRDALAAKGLGQSHIMVLEALLKLRQCCCDPRLLPSRTQGRSRAKSAKLELLMELLPTLLEEGRRVLVFSQFTSMLGLIAAELKAADIGHISLTGRSRNRDKLVERFQSGEVPVFLISLKAGGVGLNLTAADTVIIYDPWWNPAVEQQAIDRAHRIGQSKSVFVYRLITEGSIEEKILQLQEQKRLLTCGVMEASDAAVPAGLSEEQVLALLQAV